MKVERPERQSLQLQRVSREDQRGREAERDRIEAERQISLYELYSERFFVNGLKDNPE